MQLRKHNDMTDIVQAQPKRHHNTPNPAPDPVAPVADQSWQRGERRSGASPRLTFSVQIRGEQRSKWSKWSKWSEYTETNIMYITFCFTVYVMFNWESVFYSAVALRKLHGNCCTRSTVPPLTCGLHLAHEKGLLRYEAEVGTEHTS